MHRSGVKIVAVPVGPTFRATVSFTETFFYYCVGVRSSLSGPDAINGTIVHSAGGRLNL